MKALVSSITVVAAALTIFSLPTPADQGTFGQYTERGAGAQIVDVGTTNHDGGGGHGGFICFPFICG